MPQLFNEIIKYNWIIFILSAGNTQVYSAHFDIIYGKSSCALMALIHPKGIFLLGTTESVVIVIKYQSHNDILVNPVPM